jgi:hypothetical protein
MLFTETAVFTKRAKELLDDETYGLLQVRLLICPDAGHVIEGTGGAQNPRPSERPRQTRRRQSHLLPLHGKVTYHLALHLREE